MMDKEYLETTLHTVDDKVKYVAKAGENPEITIDYYPPIGCGEGYTSLELLLISFASCISTAVLSLLRAKMRRNVTSLRASAKGLLRKEHPRAITDIKLELVIKSADAQEEDVKAAIASSEAKICPVWAMLKGNVNIDVSFTIER